MKTFDELYWPKLLTDTPAELIQFRQLSSRWVAGSFRCNLCTENWQRVRRILKNIFSLSRSKCLTTFPPLLAYLQMQLGKLFKPIPLFILILEPKKGLIFHFQEGFLFFCFLLVSFGHIASLLHLASWPMFNLAPSLFCFPFLPFHFLLWLCLKDCRKFLEKNF